MKGLTDVMVLTRLSAGHIPSVLSVCPMTPPQLAAVCDRALAPWADDRYASAADMAYDLERCLEELGERGSLGDIGGTIAQLFAVERAELHAKLAAHLMELGHVWPAPPPRRSASRLREAPLRELTGPSRFFATSVSPDDLNAPPSAATESGPRSRGSAIPMRLLWGALIVALTASAVVLTMLWHTLRRLSPPPPQTRPAASAGPTGR